MILAATHPDLMGPIVINGAPMSYWAGQDGRNPIRYSAALPAALCPALLAADLGDGKFDGAHLVLNFELLNPGNNWFRKNYDLFANVDTGRRAFFEFERWWSGFYFMNGEEIRWIIENLFVGNKLSRGEACLGDGHALRPDARSRRRSSCSRRMGDNITPPQQALNWIADLYGSVEEIAAHGQVIIYTAARKHRPPRHFRFRPGRQANSTSRSARWSKPSSRWRPGFMKC